MKTLIAGIGNIFNKDDGYGVEVAQRLAQRRGQSSLPADVRVEDYGIRGLHLALELLEGYDLLVLVDALAGNDEPGTITVMEPTLDDDAPPLDAHAMNPQAVLGMVAGMGGEVGQVIVVGCQPADIDEGIGLTAPVAAAVEESVQIIESLIAERKQPCVV